MLTGVQLGTNTAGCIITPRGCDEVRQTSASFEMEFKKFKNTYN